MSVRFSEIQFRNNNNIDISLTIEAPIGTIVAGPLTVPANSSKTGNPNVDNCMSVRLTASDSTHGPFSQTFATAPPVAGVPCFLHQVAVSYTIATFRGRVIAHTEDFD
jgi:hypothetical protein